MKSALASRFAVVALFATTLVAALPAPAKAQVVTLTPYTWDFTKTGAQTWQNAANWTPAGFPNANNHSANLSGPLGANLNVSVGTGVTVAGVTLGATTAARTTEISGTMLTFRNNVTAPSADFNRDSIVDGGDFLVWQRNLGLVNQTDNTNGDADADTQVDGADLPLWREQYGTGADLAGFNYYAGSINSFGVAGSTHTVSANVHLDNEQLEIAGTTPLVINGNLSYIGDPNNANISNAALRVVTENANVTLNGNLVFADNDAAEGIDFAINDVGRSQGTLTINGILSGEGDILIGPQATGLPRPLSRVVLNGNNTFFGSIRAGRGVLVLGHDNALGLNDGGTPDPADDQYAAYRQTGPTTVFGYIIESTDDARVIRNPMVIGQWQTFGGQNSIEWAGEISQTNNRGVTNLLPAGEELKLSGRINIFEEAEVGVVRRFEIHGTGTTRITGSVRNLPDDAMNTAEDHQLVQHGQGVLIVDVAAGDNNHIGDDVIYLGNWHYADNDSLNVGGGQIRAFGGAIGVDTGVANNATFAGMIRSTSVGGLQLAASDAAATLDFTSTLANAANMTVAAPETGLTFTGTIVPATNRYQLGGGTGKLTLPSAQLTGANNLEVRNGGTVELLGDNTYTGTTKILTKFTSTNDAVAADSGPATYFSQVAPTLVVDKLANGGVASSIGAATSDAANILIHGSTLKYVGAGDSTNRLFTIGTGGATIDASGTGAVSFTNTGALGRDEAEDRLGTLDDFTGTRAANAIYDMTDTSDIMPGMTATDPDPGGLGAPGPMGQPVATNPPVIAGPTSVLSPSATQTTVTGVSDDGTTAGLSQEYGFRLKANTRIVFGTVPRTLTLAGTSTGENALASAITNSDKGGVVNVAKTGAGKWVLTGANTYTGTTTVTAGTLLVNGTNSGGGAVTVATGATLGGTGAITGNVTVTGTLAPGASAGALTVTGNATFNTGSTLLVELGGAGAGQFDELNLSGMLTAGGVFDVDLINGFVPAVGNSFDVLDFASATGAFSLSLPNLGAGKAWNTASLLTTGTISVAAAIGAVPEPASAALMLGAALMLRTRRGRRR